MSYRSRMPEAVVFSTSGHPSAAAATAAAAAPRGIDYSGSSSSTHNNNTAAKRTNGSTHNNNNNTSTSSSIGDSNHEVLYQLPAAVAAAYRQQEQQESHVQQQVRLAVAAAGSHPDGALLYPDANDRDSGTEGSFADDEEVEDGTHHGFDDGTMGSSLGGAPHPRNGGGGGSLSSTINSSSTHHHLHSTQQQQQPVGYKGIMLLPGIEHIQLGDSQYLGTVDTEGRMAGYGKATWISGDEYEGEWLCDRMHGKGTYRWPDGEYFKGEYVDGFMNGFGEMKDSTGLYVGDWVDDMRQGQGRMEYTGGNIYEGQWLGGMRHGHGKLIETSGIVYEGEFARNEKEGKGVQSFPDGDMYDGDFSQGKPNGRGTYTWRDGTRYVGAFRDGLKHGEGCEWLPDGGWVAGNFIDGRYDEDQVVRHKAVASTFEEPELPEEMATVLQPLDHERLARLTMAAHAAERRLGRGGGGGSRRYRRNSTATDGDSDSDASPLTKTMNSVGSSGGSGGSPFAAALRPYILTERDLENWTQGKIIGKGSFGAVYEALLTSGRTVCCKVIELGNVESCEELEKLQNEIALMRRMHHPNIVQYYGSIEDKEKNTINIFMELVSGGSINSFVKKFKTIPELTMRQWAYQMVCGVKYLHDCGIVHRDIKGDNVLVTVDSIVKLADFGCSKSIDDACSATHGCETMVGTPYWMAPEVIKCEAGGYGVKSDIWSIGCTIVEMITGKPPWPECNSMWAAVYKIANSTGLPTEIPPDLDPQLMDLLAQCFERDPRKRPSAAELLQHPFLAEVEESVMASTTFDSV